MDTRRRVSAAVSEFAKEVKCFTQQLGDGVNLLKRTTDYSPNVGALEFKDVLADLEDEVADLTQQVQHLEHCTVDAISFEELLGHCVAVYKSNNEGIHRLEAHLEQYGYTASGNLVEPEDPMAMLPETDDMEMDEDNVVSDHDEDAQTDGDAALASVRLGQALGTPYHLSAAAKAHLRSRIQTPGMPLLRRAAFDSDMEDEDEGGEDTALMPAAGSDHLNHRQHTPGAKAAGHSLDYVDNEIRGHPVNADGCTKLGDKASAANEHDENMDPQDNITRNVQTDHKAAFSMAPKSARKQTPSIISPDSNGSLTPEGLMMMSPSLAALQAKYGNAEIVDTAPDIWAPKQDEQGMSDTPVASLPTSRLQHPPAAAGLHLQLDSLSLSQQPAPKPTPVLEDDTCALYQQLISGGQQFKGKTMGYGAATSRPMPSAYPPASASCTSHLGGTAGAPASTNADSSQVQLGQLANKLDQLEDMWVTSGQAALTPRRASKSAGTHAGRDDAHQAAQQPSVAPTAAGPMPAAAPSLPASFAKFEFLNPATGVEPQAWPFGNKADSTMSSIPSTMPSVPPTASLHAAMSFTPGDAALLAKYGSGVSSAATPSLAHMTSNLSPGTAQLLSRVFGNRQPGSKGSLSQAPSTMPSTAVVSTSTHTAAVFEPAAAPSAQVAAQPTAASGNRCAAKPVTGEEYATLPSFLRSQLPLDGLNTALGGMSSLGKQQVTMDELSGLCGGALSSKSKVVVNMLVKLGRIEMAGATKFTMISR